MVVREVEAMGTLTFEKPGAVARGVLALEVQVTAASEPHGVLFSIFRICTCRISFK